MGSLSRIKAESMGNSGAEFFSNNLLINGSFNVWQKGTTVTDWGSFGYPVDNVQIGYDGTPASGRTVSRQAFATGQTDVTEGDPLYYLQYVFPSCGTPTNYLRFPVESVRTLAGKQATFSFWAKVPSGTMTIGVAICQEFGSGGSPSAGVYPAQTNFTVTSTWQKFVYTATLGSIAGKTLGTNNNDMIWPAIWCPTNAAGTIQIANVKLEQGSVATPFQRRPYSIDLNLCKRYYQLFGITGAASSPSQIHGTCTFPVEMRATPSSIGVANATNAAVSINRAAFNISSFAFIWNSGPFGVGVGVNSSDTGMTTGMTAWITPAGLYANAEL